MKNKSNLFKNKNSVYNNDKSHNFYEKEIFQKSIIITNSLNENETIEYLYEIKKIFKLLGNNKDRIKVPYLEVKGFTQILNQIRLLIEENIQNFQLIGRSTDIESNKEKIKFEILSESEKNDDLVKLKSENFLYEKKIKNFEKDIILKNEVLREKLNTLCILEIEKKCLREQMINLEENNDQIISENKRNLKIIDQFKKDLEKLQAKLEKNVFELNSLKKINENKLYENNFLIKKFSIIANVRDEFPNRNLSMISNDFLDLNYISNKSSFSNEDFKPLEEKNKILSIKRLSRDMFSQNIKGGGVGNFKDFLMAHVSNITNKNIPNVSKNNNKLITLQIPEIKTKKRSLFEDTISLDPFIKKSLLNKYRPSRDVVITEEDYKEKDYYYVLDTQEDYKVFVDDIRSESQIFINNLEKKLKSFEAKIKQLEFYCKNMRLENLKIIKLKHQNENLKKKIFEKQIKDIKNNKIAHRNTQTNFEKKKYLNWGIQTENKKNLKISLTKLILPISKKNLKKKEIHYFDINNKEIVSKISNYQLFNTIFKHLQKKINNLKQKNNQISDKSNNLQKFSNNKSKWEFKLKPSNKLDKNINENKKIFDNFKIKFFDKEKELASLFINCGSNI